MPTIRLRLFVFALIPLTNKAFLLIRSKFAVDNVFINMFQLLFIVGFDLSNLGLKLLNLKFLEKALSFILFQGA
jgi:hypothetical protein